VSKLKRELQTLDGDAGVRVEGVSNGKKLFVFVTRFDETYTSVLCPSEGEGWKTPGRPIQTREFDNVEDALSFLKTITGRNVRAFAY